MENKPLKTAGQAHAEQKNWDKYERKLYARERKNRQGRKALRARPLKNFLFFLAGLITCIVLIVGTLAVGVFVIPTDTYLGLAGVSEEDSSKYVKEELSSKSLFNLAMSMTSVGSISDVADAMPIVEEKLDELLDSVADYVTLDRDALYSASFSNITNYQDYNIKIVATLDSLGVSSMLGSVGNMSLFKQDSKVYNDSDEQATVAYVESQATADTPVNYKLYTYKSGEEYLTASNDDNSGWATGVTQETLLYYASFLTTPISDVLDIAMDRLNTLPIIDILRVFSDIPDDNMIAKVLGKTTITGIGNIDFTTIELSNFIDRYESDNTTETQMYRILRSAFNVDASRDITVGDLSGTFNIEGIKLSEVISEDSVGESLKDILCSAIGKEYSEIVVSDLTGLDFDTVSLSNFIDRYESDNVTETQIYKILRSAFNVDASEDITVGDLGGTFNVDGIKLSEVMPEDSIDESLKDFLCSVIDKEYGEIIVSDLSGLDFDTVSLSNFIDRYESDNVTETQIYRILRAAYNIDASSDITVADLSGEFDISGVALSTVMDADAMDDSLESLLCDITGKTYDEITVSDMENLDIGEIKLSTVLDELDVGHYTAYESGTAEYNEAKEEYENNKKLWDLLRSAITPEDGVNIKVSDLMTGFTIDNIKLSSVIENTADTKSLVDVMLDVTGKTDYDDILVSDISTFDVTQVKLSTVLVKKSSGDTGYEENKKLWDLLNEAVTPANGTEILLSDLSDGFSLNSVHLSTVIGTTDNVFLNALPADTTLGNMNDNLNAVKLSDVFDYECFTTDDQKAITDFTNGSAYTYDEDLVYTYKKVATDNGDKYVLSETAGEDGNLYYVSKTSKVWMLIYYVAGTKDADGFATEYTPTNITLGDMEDKLNALSDTITDGTIRQLVMCGLFEPNVKYEKITGIINSYLYASTLTKSIGG